MEADPSPESRSINTACDEQNNQFTAADSLEYVL